MSGAREARLMHEAYNSGRTEERKALLARLREPDDQLLVDVAYATSTRWAKVRAISAAIAAALDPSPPPTENENAGRD